MLFDVYGFKSLMSVMRLTPEQSLTLIPAESEVMMNLDIRVCYIARKDLPQMR